MPVCGKQNSMTFVNTNSSPEESVVAEEALYDNDI